MAEVVCIFLGVVVPSITFNSVRCSIDFGMWKYFSVGIGVSSLRSSVTGAGCSLLDDKVLGLVSELSDELYSDVSICLRVLVSSEYESEADVVLLGCADSEFSN